MNRWVAGALFALALAHAAPARANGAFPAAGQIVLDPTQPSRVFINTSYGFAVSNDAGNTWDLVCEQAIGYSGGFHPHAAITPSGKLFLGLPDGLAIGSGAACDFERVAALEGSFVADVSMAPSGDRAIARVVPPNGARPRVWASDDDLATWAPLGAELPDKTTVLTLDAAPSDPSVLYVSGLVSGTPEHGVVMVSQDGGGTWTSTLIANSFSSSGPFIGGIDPFDAGTVWVRTNGAPGRLLRSTDFGATYEELETTTGFMQAFRLTPDGLHAYFGGPVDGLSKLDTQDASVEVLSEVGARCVTLDPLDSDKVYVCADELMSDFSAGRSIDGGHTFSSMFEQRCVRGILACDAASDVGATCPAEWPAIAMQLGADGSCQSSAGGAGGAGGGSATTGTITGAGGAGGSPARGGGGAGGSGGGGESGCDCSMGRPAPSRLEWVAFAGLFAAYWSGRLTKRATRAALGRDALKRRARRASTRVDRSTRSS
ncbi:MAG: hypothetical protein U0271_30455 [Polyangiaceae bacterium]